MNPGIRTLVGIALMAVAQSGCSKIDAILAPSPSGGSANFSVYAAMGTSISAGTESDGLVVHHQRKSFPYGFAQQAGSASFTIPSISPDGILPLLELKSLSPLIISRAGRTQGNPTNSAQATAYHNMAVPGAILADVTSSALYSRSAIFNLIVRGRGTILSEVASLNPTFLTFEFGANEVLGPATSGSGTPVITGVQYASLLTATLNAIAQAAPNAKMALMNVPNVTTIPFFTTFSWVALDTLGNPSPLIGPGGTPLQPGDLVLLTAGATLAGGTGFATNTRSYVSGVRGNGQPLSDALVLSASEAASIQASVTAYNTAIDSAATGRGGALVDLNGLLKQAATSGIYFRGSTYTSEFITGGLFTLDGVHPTDFAHGLILNTLIKAVNAKFGSSIPLANLNDYATSTPSAQRPALNGGALPVIEEAEAIYRDMFSVRFPMGVASGVAQ